MDAILPNGQKEKVVPETEPDWCPVCNYTGTMALQPGAFIRYREGWEHQKTLQLTYRCPRHKCGALFLAEFDFSGWTSHRRSTWDLKRVYPKLPSPPELPECVSALSPSFVGLYSQALRADFHGLDDVFGLALRKAFEFLIKDYCISKDSAAEAAIKKEFLGNVIKNRVSDPNVKICAERATWLGNDETHYERRWSAHDVADLHTLVKLTMNWISNEQLTQAYLESMQPNATKGEQAGASDSDKLAN
jgi:hypothetical protein